MCYQRIGRIKAFFWGGDQSNRKIPWAKWDYILTKKENGGLGIGALEDLNNALIAKWFWRYKKEEGAFWIKVLESIHGKLHSWVDSNSIKIGKTWKSIVQQWDNLREFALDPRQVIMKKVRDGNNTHFWLDWWISDRPLMLNFPRLYQLENKKQVMIRNKLESDGGLEAWRSSLREGRNKEEFHNLCTLLSDFSPSNNRDIWWCPDGPKGCFKVAWLRNKISQSRRNVIGKNYCCKWVPKRINIFIWRLLNNRLAVNTALANRGLKMDSTLCEVCKEEEESLSHSFVECRRSKLIWSFIGVWWNVPVNANNLAATSETESERMQTWLQDFLALVKSPLEKKIFKIVAIATLSNIWIERNEAIFHQRNSPEDVFYRIQKEALLWLECRSSKLDLDWRLCLSSPNVAFKPM